MSFCNCFSPSPQLGKGNVYYEDAEPPEVMFTDKQNRFSQEVLTGLRGFEAPTTAGRSHATVHFLHRNKRHQGQAQREPSTNFRRVASVAPVLDAPQVNGSLKKTDLWTQSRQNLEEAIEEEKENSTHKTWDSDLLSHEQRLDQRLDKLKLDMFIMGSDGACQFRSISYGLFGTEAYHRAVRRKAVQYMRDHRSDFEAFVGDDMDGWLKEMSQHESWGDELTLRALCEAYGIVINVITSDQQHWFMRYEPEAQPKKAAEVFITYIAPIHYNAVRRKTQASQLRRSFSRQRSGSRIQQALDRASSQSFTEQHQRLAQQHNQAQTDAAAGQGNVPGIRTARNSGLQGLASVREEDPTENLADTPAAQPVSNCVPTGTTAAIPTGTTAAIPIPAAVPRTTSGSSRGSSQGSQKRISPKPVHYGMSESSSPLPVLHSPFAAAAAMPV